MKTKLLAIFLLFITLITFLQDKALAWGPITHMTILDDVINDPTLDPNVKKILQENLKYAKGGATGPDMYYFGSVFAERCANMAHYCSPGDLAKKMLALAKTPQEKAFAYGWMLHVVTDSIGHEWVNSVAGGEYDPENSTIKSAHRDIEMSIDKKNFLLHADVKEIVDPDSGASATFYNYDTDITAPNKFLQKVFIETYGHKFNAPDILSGLDAEIKAQAVYNVEPAWIMSTKDSEKYNTAEYQTAYQRSILEAINALNSAGATLKNWDLDTGKAPGDDGYGGYEKCEKYGKLYKGGTISQTNPGGDHPDDTVSVDSGNLASETVSLDSLYRLAAKKDKKWVLWQKALQDANAEYEALPADVSPELRGAKLNKISALINMLNDPFNYREFTINNPQLSSEIMEVPDVAVIENGYYEDITKLINKWQEPVRTLSIDFSPAVVNNHPVLVIPSGGLYGLENSTFFKTSLSEYVKSGGTLIVFAQQHGYEFSVLPVPQESDGTFRNITGYGWTEDQSCFTNAAYIENYHQILSGQSKSTPTLNMDGYLTNYPSNSTVLLRRTANGQPALLMYDYGQGKVVVTSMYSDFAYSRSQASKEEIALVRDMISWAKKPAQLPEVRPSGTVSLNITVVNNSTTDATRVKLTVINPDRNIITEQTISASIPAGQSATIPFSYTTTSNSPLGIWWVDYTILDSGGNIIQPQTETDSGRFIIHGKVRGV